MKAAQRRLRCSRAVAVAIVGSRWWAAFAGLVVLVGPPAVRQAERFGSELPQTVRDLYELPLVGDRLREADAATQVEEWADGLPGRLDAGRASAARRTPS